MARRGPVPLSVRRGSPARTEFRACPDPGRSLGRTSSAPPGEQLVACGRRAAVSSLSRHQRRVRLWPCSGVWVTPQAPLRHLRSPQVALTADVPPLRQADRPAWVFFFLERWSGTTQREPETSSFDFNFLCCELMRPSPSKLGLPSAARPPARLRVVGPQGCTFTTIVRDSARGSRPVPVTQFQALPWGKHW